MRAMSRWSQFVAPRPGAVDGPTSCRPPSATRTSDSTAPSTASTVAPASPTNASASSTCSGCTSACKRRWPPKPPGRSARPRRVPARVSRKLNRGTAAGRDSATRRVRRPSAESRTGRWIDGWKFAGMGRPATCAARHGFRRTCTCPMRPTLGPAPWPRGPVVPVAPWPWRWCILAIVGHPDRRPPAGVPTAIGCDTDASTQAPSKP